ncbi:hypothetical protein C8Q80DRAFT_1271016 [Daedaleopsis nitida]|nr:hypothetical protein C8Q80DRAFT_1271016 [Daedaleopsis nitida]
MSRGHVKKTDIPTPIEEEAAFEAEVSITRIPPSPLDFDTHRQRFNTNRLLTRSPSPRTSEFDGVDIGPKHRKRTISLRTCPSSLRRRHSEDGVAEPMIVESPSNISMRQDLLKVSEYPEYLVEFEGSEVIQLWQILPELFSPSESRDPERATEQAWSNCAKEMIHYDAANVTRWKEEIDTLLVFAGLFSAVVTAFLVESCKSLHPEPTERIAAVLELIAAEIRNATIEESPIGPTVDTSFWLGEYAAGIMTISRSRVSRKHAHTRQHRHNALCKWRVKTIMTALPVILQVALVFFLVGISELLWAFNRNVGIVAISFLAALLAFSLVTSVLPMFSEDCSYRSPQAFALYFGTQLLTCTRLAGPVECEEELKPVPTHTGTQVLLNAQPQVRRLLSWLSEHGGKRVHWSWKAREEAKLLACHSNYDVTMLDELDGVKMDLETLQNIVQPCLLTLESREALTCVRKLLIRRADAVVFELPFWTHSLDRETLLTLLNILLDLLGEGTREVATPSQRFDEDQQWQLLQMLHRLVVEVPGHITLLEGRCDRIFTVLLACRRRRPSQQPAENRKLIYGLLVTLTGEVPPPSAVTSQDVDDVITYASGEIASTDFSNDDRTVLSICTIVVVIIRALHTHHLDGTSCPDGPSPQLRQVLDLFCSTLDKVIIPKFAAGTEPPENPGEYFAVINDFFKSFEALLVFLGTSVSMADSWTAVKRKISELDERCSKGVSQSVDAMGRTTKKIMDNIESLQFAKGHVPQRRATSESFRRVAAPPKVPLRQTLSEPVEVNTGVVDLIASTFHCHSAKRDECPV